MVLSLETAALLMGRATLSPCFAFAVSQFASDDDMAAMRAPGVRLITAASDGDKKGVKKWLDGGVDVDSRDWDKLTPLIAASSQGHLVRRTENILHWYRTTVIIGFNDPDRSLFFQLLIAVEAGSLTLIPG